LATTLVDLLFLAMAWENLGKPILHLKLWIRVSDPDRRDGNADFSHGVCPECAKKHYPQIDFCKMKEE